jgi:hypothetical protein
MLRGANLTLWLVRCTNIATDMVSFPQFFPTLHTIFIKSPYFITLLTEMLLRCRLWGSISYGAQSYDAAIVDPAAPSCASF